MSCPSMLASAHSQIRLIETEQALFLCPIAEQWESYQQLDGNNNSPSCLVISRPTGACQLVSKVDKPSFQENSGQIIYGVLGIIKGDNCSFLIVATDRERIGEILGSDVFKLTNTRIIPIHSDEIGCDEEEMLTVEHLEESLSSPYLYFSYTRQLTRTQAWIEDAGSDATAEGGDRSSRRKAMLEGEADRFVWNYALCQPLIDAGLHMFVLPLVCGFVGFIPSAEINAHQVDVILVARRSRHRHGTRWNRRGADKTGEVANSVESEQMVVVRPEAGSGVRPSIASYVEVRGSIPLFWQTPPKKLKWNPKLILAAGRDSMPVFTRHLRHMYDQYGGSTTCISLVEQHGDKESPLFEAYESHMARLRAEEPSVARLLSFDFHKELGTTNYAAGLASLTAQVHRDQDAQGMFLRAADGAARRQRGVFRVNCVDCLDRTNVVMFHLARRALELHLCTEGVLSSEAEQGRGGEGQVAVGLREAAPETDQWYNEMWADHGDAISIQYTGTGALKADFTRTGKRSGMGILNDGINSLTRYYKGNFQDGSRQDAIDLFLGKCTAAQLLGRNAIRARRKEASGNPMSMLTGAGRGRRMTIMGDSAAVQQQVAALVGSLDVAQDHLPQMVIKSKTLKVDPSKLDKDKAWYTQLKWDGFTSRCLEISGLFLHYYKDASKLELRGSLNLSYGFLEELPMGVVEAGAEAWTMATSDLRACSRFVVVAVDGRGVCLGFRSSSAADSWHRALSLMGDFATRQIRAESSVQGAGSEDPEKEVDEDAAFEAAFDEAEAEALEEGPDPAPAQGTRTTEKRTGSPPPASPPPGLRLQDLDDDSDSDLDDQDREAGTAASSSQEAPPPGLRIGAGAVAAGAGPGVHKEGWLRKQGGGRGGVGLKNWKQRWFVLRGPFLAYFSKGGQGHLEQKGELPLQDARLSVEPGDSIEGERKMVIVTDKHKLVVSAAFEVIMSWHAAIDAVVTTIAAEGTDSPRTNAFKKVSKMKQSIKSMKSVFK